MLPVDLSREAYRELRRDPSRWRDAVVAVAARHGLVAGAPRPLGGSNLVAAVDGDRVVKLFPPFLRYQWAAERLALGAVRIALPTPALLHEGELDGWTYLVMTRLDGESLQDVWPRAPHAQRSDLLAQIGAVIADVHRLDPGPIAGLGPAWDDFVRTQRDGCVARHRRLGLPGPLLAGIDGYLERTAPLLPRGEPDVILTGEYTPENLLVGPDGRLAGMIDFGDVWSGPADYDLLGPATFMAGGDPGHLRALLRGRGRREDPALRDRLMALLLLHRHSDLGLQVQIDGWRERAATLDELAALIFPLW